MEVVAWGAGGVLIMISALRFLGCLWLFVHLLNFEFASSSEGME